MLRMLSLQYGFYARMGKHQKKQTYKNNVRRGGLIYFSTGSSVKNAVKNAQNVNFV